MLDRLLAAAASTCDAEMCCPQFATPPPSRKLLHTQLARFCCLGRSVRSEVGGGGEGQYEGWLPARRRPEGFAASGNQDRCVCDCRTLKNVWWAWALRLGEHGCACVEVPVQICDHRSRRTP